MWDPIVTYLETIPSLIELCSRPDPCLSGLIQLSTEGPIIHRQRFFHINAPLPSFTPHLIIIIQVRYSNWVLKLNARAHIFHVLNSKAQQYLKIVQLEWRRVITVTFSNFKHTLWRKIRHLDTIPSYQVSLNFTEYLSRASFLMFKRLFDPHLKSGPNFLRGGTTWPNYIASGNRH